MGLSHGGETIAMSHSYTSLLTHVVFSTKDRKPFIDATLESRLFPYFGGVLRQLGGKLYTVNGVEDHVHLLVELPPALAVAEAVRKIKGGSTHWIHETFSDRGAFAWQTGYSGFSVSKSNVPQVASYIERQKTHHQSASFEDELRQLLQRHGLPFDER